MNLLNFGSDSFQSGFLQLLLGNSGTAVVLGISLLIMLVFIIILAVRLQRAMTEAAENNAKINQYIAALPPEKLSIVMAIYNSTRKELGFGIVLSLIGGLFAAQRIYLGSTKSAVFSVIFFWTGIPAIITVFDLMNMPKTVSEYNLGVIQSLYNQLAAPKIE